MNILLLFTILTFINVVLQIVKSLCTIRCTTFISACVNALAYGLYTFVIFYTAADGLSLWTKAAITAVANFFGIYIANFIFKKIFSQTVRWKIEILYLIRIARILKNILMLGILNGAFVVGAMVGQIIQYSVPIRKQAQRSVKFFLLKQNTISLNV